MSASSSDTMITALQRIRNTAEELKQITAAHAPLMTLPHIDDAIDTVVLPVPSCIEGQLLACHISVSLASRFSDAFSRKAADLHKMAQDNLREMLVSMSHLYSSSQADQYNSMKQRLVQLQTVSYKQKLRSWEEDAVALALKASELSSATAVPAIRAKATFNHVSAFPSSTFLSLMMHR
jgi:hypothetical protein